MAKILLHRDNFFHNLRFILSLLPKNCNLALVLKDNAYGHGLKEMALLASEFDVKNIFVKNNAEANCIDSMFENIFVLYPCFSDIQNCINPKIVPVIQSIEALKSIPNNSKIALKINLMMNRNGVSDLDTALRMISEKNLYLDLVLSHSAFAGFDDDKFSLEKKLFSELKSKISRLRPLDPIKFSFLNSSGIFGSEASDFYDLVRVGIGAYGYGHPELLPVLELFAHKISEHKITNQPVGYNGVNSATGFVASYDLGYGDGIYHKFNGIYETTQKHRILSAISMDCMSIISKDGKVLPNELSIFNNAQTFSCFTNQSVYDVLVKLSHSIPRQIS